MTPEEVVRFTSDPTASVSRKKLDACEAALSAHRFAIERIAKNLGIDPWRDAKPKPKVTDKMVAAALDCWINGRQECSSRDYSMRVALEAAIAAMDDVS